MPSTYYLSHPDAEHSSDSSIYNVSSCQYLAYADGDEEEGGSRNQIPNSAPNSGNGANGIFHFPGIDCKLGKRIHALRQHFLVLFTPLLLSPLLFSNAPEYKCAFCVALMAMYWAAEVMPLAVTAMLPAVLFPITGILSAKEVTREFLNDTTFLFIGGLIVATAVERCGLHERVALGVLTLVGSEPRRIMLGFMSITALLSMFISNTATTAMMLPIGQSVILLLSRHASQKCCERDSSATELLGSRMESVQTATLKKQMLFPTQKAHPNAPLTQMAKGLILSIAFAANIGGIATLTGTPPNLVLVGILSTLFPDVETGVTYLSWIALTLPFMVCSLLVCWLLLCLIFLRNTPSADPNVRIMMRKRNQELPSMSFAEKSVAFCFLLLLFLWIARDPGFMPGIGDLFPRDCYTDSTSAMFVAVLLFLVPAENPFWPHETAKLAETKADNAKAAAQSNVERSVPTTTESTQKRLMDWPTMQKQFPWSVVLLLGGGFALAAGVKESGLSTLIAQTLSQLEQQPVWVIQLVCIFIIMFVTNICSNTVTASIFIPIVSSMAQRSGIHPLALMLPTTLACSLAFLLPVGTPPNAIAFSSGLLRVSDLILSGLTISVVTAIIMVGYLAVFAPLILPIEHFPEWASLSNETLFKRS